MAAIAFLVTPLLTLLIELGPSLREPYDTWVLLIPLGTGILVLNLVRMPHWLRLGLNLLYFPCAAYLEFIVGMALTCGLHRNCG